METKQGPRVSEIQQKFCPESWMTEKKLEYIWTRERATGQLVMHSYDTGERTYEKVMPNERVVQSYIIRSLADSTMRAVAVVTGGGGKQIDVNRWWVSLINAQTKFASDLIANSTPFSHMSDENGIACFVANVGGGYIFTSAEYLAEKRRLEWAETLAQEKQLIRQEKEEYFARAKYCLTRTDIQGLLPLSPTYTCFVDETARPLQVYALLGQDMNIHICAVINKCCTQLQAKLKYNSAGCCEYSFVSEKCTISKAFTAVQEQSHFGTKLLGVRRRGDIIVIGQKPFLVINIGGGYFEIYSTNWQEEKEEIARREAHKYKTPNER